MENNFFLRQYLCQYLFLLGTFEKQYDKTSVLSDNVSLFAEPLYPAVFVFLQTGVN